MKVLVVGGGGREHALVWGLERGRSVDEILCAPGNPGIAEIAECFDVDATDIPAIVELAKRTQPDLVVVGPEAPLVAGLADSLADANIRVFGPRARGALLEGSKSYAKKLMKVKGIPTGKSQEFELAADAIRYVEQIDGPVVVKADGLTAGKGVTVCNDASEARRAIQAAITEGRFGDAGSRILIEERMIGPELSILAFCDGKSILPMQAAQDFKRIRDGNEGPNTGGMGAYSPVAICTDEVFGQAIDRILEPIAAALQDEGEPYVGVIYAGLMLDPEGLKVIEFNCRFGDPEAQVLIPRLESDLGEVMCACVDGSLSTINLDWSADAAVCVVLASGGYPDAPVTMGLPIHGLEAASAPGGQVFHSGTARLDGQLVTAGGRVLAVTATGKDARMARKHAYGAVEQISFEGMQFRSDIAAEN